MGAVACGDDAPLEGDADMAIDASAPAADDAGRSADASTADEVDGGRPVKVEIEFEARVGDESFDCTSTYDVGIGPTRVMPLDFRMYVHDVALLTQDGEHPVALEQDGVFQDGTVALLDFEDDRGSCSNGTTATHSILVGEVPEREYTGLTFKIGVPEQRNHVNQAQSPSPLNIEGMFWSWTTGYKFLRVDVMPMDEATGFNVHLGSTMCAGDAAAGEAVTCQRANRPQVRFASFDASKHRIVVDLAALLATSDVGQNMDGPPGCMSAPTDPECPAIFDALGLSLDTGESSENPTFLRVIDK
jgi:uncharacterized repeat protein (TIGR04052 family)